ncbi:MAG: hypothetical protein ACE14V_03055 [bacterium]
MASEIKRSKKIIKILLYCFLAIIVLGFIGIILLVTQPWEKEELVLSAKIPETTLTAELWIKDDWLDYGYHYVWLIIRDEKDNRQTYHFHGDTYFSFEHTVFLLSPDGRYLRIEEGIARGETEVIGEFDIKTKTLKQGNNESISKREGCKVIAEVRRKAEERF